MIVYIQRSKVPTHQTLHKAMAASGLKLRYFRLFFLPIRRGIIYIHFPDSCVSTASTWKIVPKFSAFIVSVLMARLGRSPIIWEVNNLQSHEQRFPIFERILMTVLTRSVAGVIHNSNSSVHDVTETYPALKRAHCTVIPEPNFRHIYLERGDSARGRQILGVDEGDTVLLSFGLIRRYKGLDKLIEQFKQVNGAALRLVIVGIPIDQTHAEELQHAAASDPRIRVIFRKIPHAEVPHIYAAAALHCAPFRNTLNSGSVVLALSLACPVVAPRLGTLPDLEERVGADWIMLYDGKLNPPIMRAAIAWARLPRLQPPALGFCDFAKVAADTVNFVNRIGALNSSSEKQLTSSGEN